ncbi:protein rolling stone-like [Oculina patagonica]
MGYNLGTRHVREDGEVVFIPDDSEASRAITMAWFHEALWVIYNIASVAANLVTLAFWVLLFSNSKISADTIIFHGVNSIVIIADTMLSSVPVRLFHVIYPMLYCISYIVFTLIYWAVGGTNSFGMPYIYPMTDYSGRPVLTAVSQLCLFFIGLPLFQSLMFAIYRLRIWIKTKCGK